MGARCLSLFVIFVSNPAAVAYYDLASDCAVPRLWDLCTRLLRRFSLDSRFCHWLFGFAVPEELRRLPLGLFMLKKVVRIAELD